MRREVIRLSPQRADPLSWILAFNLPLMMACGAVATTSVLLLLSELSGIDPVPVSLAGALTAIACLVIYRAAQPQREFFRVRDCIVPLVLAGAASWISAIAYIERTAGVELWMGAYCFAVVIIALVPYSSALTLASCGVLGAIICGALSAVYFDYASGSELVRVALASVVPLQAGLAGAVFSAVVVLSLLRWQELPYDTSERADADTDFAERLRDRGAPPTIGPEVQALLERVAQEGRVGSRDRELALDLARGIRAELEIVLNRSWLDALAHERSLTVVDPGRVAERATPVQRAAIRRLILAVLDSPVLHEESLRIELRAGDDGTTAVALSMKIDLPEGRRVMMLAPYFVSLRSTVDKLQWVRGEQLRLKFQLPAPAAPPGWAADEAGSP